MEKTNSNAPDGEFALVRGYLGFAVVLLKDSAQNWGQEILTTGTREEMKALHKLMYAAHGKD